MQDLDQIVASVGGIHFAFDPHSQQIAAENLPDPWGQLEMDRKTPCHEQDHEDLSVSTAISLDSGICVEADVVQRCSRATSTESGSPLTRASSHSPLAASVIRSRSQTRRLLSPRHLTSSPMASPEETDGPSKFSTWKVPVQPSNVPTSNVQGDGRTGLDNYW
jgi:hypothetical protein